MALNRHLVGQAVLVALEVLMERGGPVVRVKVYEGADSVEAVGVEGIPPNGNDDVIVVHLHAIVALEPAGTGGLERLPKTWVRWRFNSIKKNSFLKETKVEIEVVTVYVL